MILAIILCCKVVQPLHLVLRFKCARKIGFLFAWPAFEMGLNGVWPDATCTKWADPKVLEVKKFLVSQASDLFNSSGYLDVSGISSHQGCTSNPHVEANNFLLLTSCLGCVNHAKLPANDLYEAAVAVGFSWIYDLWIHDLWVLTERPSHRV